MTRAGLAERVGVEWAYGHVTTRRGRGAMSNMENGVKAALIVASSDEQDATVAWPGDRTFSRSAPSHTVAARQRPLSR